MGGGYKNCILGQSQIGSIHDIWKKSTIRDFSMTLILYPWLFKALLSQNGRAGLNEVMVEGGRCLSVLLSLHALRPKQTNHSLIANFTNLQLYFLTEHNRVKHWKSLLTLLVLLLNEFTGLLSIQCPNKFSSLILYFMYLFLVQP